MKSSSLHRLNADVGLPKWKRGLWFLFNWLNNALFPRAKSRGLEIRPFSSELGDEQWDKIEKKSSPSRALSDLFWMQLPWKAIESELGDVHIVDTGCGSGGYGVKLQEFSHGRIASYTGLDEYPHPDWARKMQEYPYLELLQADSKSLRKHIPAKTNLFVSQSAIEHFEEDLGYFRQIRNFIKRSEKNVLQIHLFPSSVCLKLFRQHGVRQYTPRTVSMIVDLFRSNSYAILYALGDTNCNALHWEYITKPIYLEKTGDWRESRTEAYRRALRLALSQDLQQGRIRQPAFYALLIHSNSTRRLF